MWAQGTGGVGGVDEPDDDFGRALAAGDFDGDGYTDLAIGVPGEDVRGSDHTLYQVAVQVLYGSSLGLDGSRDQIWSQDSAGIVGNAEYNDEFGGALTSGDLNGDGRADLAIGVDGENDNFGAVNVIYGSSSGLAAAGNQVWSQDSAGIGGTGKTYDRFGHALAAADFNGNGVDDLAIGAPSYEGAAGAGAGEVNVILGTSGGLAAAGNQLWSQDTAGILGVGKPGDEFGSALAAADLGNGTGVDLAIGLPEKEVGGTDAGAVAVIYGARSGLVAAGNQVWSQDTRSMAGGSDQDDHFGRQLTAADLGRSGHADLVVAVPGEGTASKPWLGAVSVLYGSTTGLTYIGNQLWSQDSAGIADVGEPYDGFGVGVSAR